MALEKFIPDIQEQLRHKGFPRFTKGQMHEFLLQPQGPPKFNITDRFEFQDKGGNLGIVLTPTSFAIQTNKYDSFDHFGEIFSTTLHVVNRVLGITLAERVGLRYVDLIRLDGNEKLSEYLSPGLLGINPTSLGVKAWTSRFESVGDTELGKLVVRCSQTDQMLPPDLFPTTLNYPNTLSPGETATLLDFDHFAEGTTDFDTDAITALVGELHDALDLAFRVSVTPTALLHWGNGEE